MSLLSFKIINHQWKDPCIKFINFLKIFLGLKLNHMQIFYLNINVVWFFNSLNKAKQILLHTINLMLDRIHREQIFEVNHARYDR